MVQAPAVQRVGQGLEHVRLAHHFPEETGTPFAGKYLVTHEPDK